MTYATEILHSRPLAELKAELIARWTRYQTYRNTMSELASLSARDLADLGLNRSQIRSVAYEHAYGKQA